MKKDQVKAKFSLKNYFKNKKIIKYCKFLSDVSKKALNYTIFFNIKKNIGESLV